MANIVDCNYSSVRINNRYALKATFSYKDFTGKTYLFRSPLLKIDPTPFLRNQQSKIYWNQSSPKDYFVDIDDSVDQVFEV